MTTLTVAGSQQTLELTDPRLVVAGYTARDQAAVRAHIDELAAIGVAPPPAVPMVYALDAALITTDSVVTVSGAQTSGEVEPVVVWCAGQRYLGIGSDHTDRELETESVADSKAAAPKPIGSSVLPFDDAVARWDDIAVRSWVDGDLYQEGQLSAMLRPDDLIGMLAERGEQPTGDAVMFCGTVPLLGGTFVHGTKWRMELGVPGSDPIILDYEVSVSG
jgi:4-hydroxyphenylacetate 3-monooxygenase